MTKNKYRKDIDGLRAIAVFAVIIYHANITIFGSVFLPGGFIGVDIFFVISGYLITKIILEELNNNKFSFLFFYERRIRRLLPALFFVSLSSITLGWFILLPETYVEASKSLISSILFVSNFYFYFTGLEYDAPNALNQPFLHTWSLSVEEQFYLLFPIFLILLTKVNRSITIIIMLFLASLIFANYLSNKNPSLAFYLIFTRAFELLTGTLIVQLEYLKKKIRKIHFYKHLPKIGICLIFLSFFLFDHNINHPSYITLIPVISTFLIIYFYDENELTNKFLSLKPMVLFGLISYSLYLWHYPIFVLVREINLTSGLIINEIFCGVFVIFISALTYRFIERPFRKKSNFSQNKIFFSTIFISVTIILVCSVIINNKGFAKRVPEILESHYKDSINLSSITKQNDKKCINRKSDFCEFKQDKLFKDEKGHIFLLGDSHLGNIQDDLQKKLSNIGYKTSILTSSGCIYLPGMNLYHKKTFKILESCSKEVQNNKRNIILKNKNSIVVLHGRYSLYLTETHFDNTEGGVEGGERMGFFSSRDKDFEDKKARLKMIKNNIELSIQEFLDHNIPVLLIYPVPEVGWNVPKEIWKRAPKNDKLLKDWLISNPITTSLDRYDERNSDITNIFNSFENKNIIRVRPSEIFCDKKTSRCYTHNDKIIYYSDDDHLSYEGGLKLNNEIIRELKIFQSKI